jgi:hypothetical protein
MTRGDVQKPSAANPPPRWVALTVAVVAVTAGLLLGKLAVRYNHLAVDSGQFGAALALNLGVDLLGGMAAAGIAVTVLRLAQPRKFWLAAATLVLPLIGAHYSRAFHPLIVAFAEVSWFLVVLCCARAKRTLGIWCIVACAACTTGIKLQSTALEQAPSVPRHGDGPSARLEHVAIK